MGAGEGRTHKTRKGGTHNHHTLETWRTTQRRGDTPREGRRRLQSDKLPPLNGCDGGKGASARRRRQCRDTSTLQGKCCTCRGGRGLCPSAAVQQCQPPHYYTLGIAAATTTAITAITTIILLCYNYTTTITAATTTTSSYNYYLHISLWCGHDNAVMDSAARILCPAARAPRNQKHHATFHHQSKRLTPNTPPFNERRPSELSLGAWGDTRHPPTASSAFE